MKQTDIDQVTRVHESGFPRHKNAREWICCNFSAYPRMQYFVAESEETGEILGYLQWSERGGFREKAVLELEHLAVLTEHRGKGIGRTLIEKALEEIQDYFHERGSIIKHVLVSTATTNEAQKLYRQTLGAEVEFVVPDLYSSDEAYMISRNFEKM